MNKTEDDELGTEELSDEELRQITGNTLRVCVWSIRVVKCLDSRVCVCV